MLVVVVAFVVNGITCVVNAVTAYVGYTGLLFKLTVVADVVVITVVVVVVAVVVVVIVVVVACFIEWKRILTSHASKKSANNGVITLQSPTTTFSFSTKRKKKFIFC